MPQIQFPPHDQIDAVATWLAIRRKARRRPELAARLLIALVQVHRQQMPLPQRAKLAQALGMKKNTINSTIRSGLNGGELREDFVVVPTLSGTGLRCKILVPSAELIAAVEAA